MNGMWYNFEFVNLQNMCCVCLGTNGARPMHTEEKSWFQSVVSKTSLLELEHKLNVCSMCGHLLRKHISFRRHCRATFHIISQSSELEPNSDMFTNLKKSLHDMTITKPTLVTIGEDNKLNLDSKENIILHVHDEMDVVDDVVDDAGTQFDGDDDVPLVRLTNNDSSNEKAKVMKRRRKVKSEKMENKPDTMSAQYTDVSSLADADSGGGGGRGGEGAGAGFSARMRRETDAYTVIKLTHQQVVEELESRRSSERFRRALYRCEPCALPFNFDDVHRAHMSRHDPAHGSFLCSMCSQYCPSAVSLRGHIKSHTTRYSCKVCGCVRRGRQHLLEHHARAHTPQHAALYTCQQHNCTFTTDKRTVMQRHVRSHRSAARLACDHCARLFTNKESLRVHLARADASRWVVCDVCPRRFLYVSQLERHRSLHHASPAPDPATASTPAPAPTDCYCVECDATFSTPDNLRLHFKKAKRHRDTNTDICRARSQKGEAARSVACPSCGRLYATHGSLRAHVRRAHHSDTHTATTQQPAPRD